ncbi:DUF1833 family protein [Methylobacterium sp. Leaf100]|uniref:DUF1833 family protein n=1 Tax=Methylobacterium sp. Leaf100 TaxID=1736252 RepID=UPI0006FF1AD7|nr:DUF1833 family protein [Methylobacterium sp. Leaf100]KQP36700.1 hypothetical protein ASF25_01725 [Methylobacterium sp. Leaf100]
MTLSAALAEAYASGDEEGVILTTCEVDHPSLDAAILLVQNVDSDLGAPGDTLALPLFEGGPRLPHQLCAFTLIPPGADMDGPTDGKLQIDNVSDLLHELMRGVVGYNEAITIGFRQYRVLPGQLDAVTGPDDDDLTGLEMTRFDISAERAEGTIAWPDGRQLNVPTGPNAFFARDDYPALFS